MAGPSVGRHWTFDVSVWERLAIKLACVFTITRVPLGRAVYE